jgi:hypothetical protein
MRFCVYVFLMVCFLGLIGGCDQPKPVWRQGKWAQVGQTERSPNPARASSECFRILLCAPDDPGINESAFPARSRIDLGLETKVHVRPLEPFIQAGSITGVYQCHMPSKPGINCEQCVDKIDCTLTTLSDADRDRNCCIGQLRRSAAQVGAPVPGPSAPRDLKVGDRFKDCVNCPEMVVVPPGTFGMGPQSDEVSVSIAQAFAVGRFAITFDE